MRPVPGRLVRYGAACGIRRPVQAGTLRDSRRTGAFRATGRVASSAVMTEPGHGTAGLTVYILLAVGGASLIARRRYPVGVLAVTVAVAIWPGVASQSRPV